MSTAVAAKPFPLLRPVFAKQSSNNYFGGGDDLNLGILFPHGGTALNGRGVGR